VHFDEISLIIVDFSLFRLEISIENRLFSKNGCHSCLRRNDKTTIKRTNSIICIILLIAK